MNLREVYEMSLNEAREASAPERTSPWSIERDALIKILTEAEGSKNEN